MGPFAAVFVGVAAGALYTLSPLTAWCVPIGALLVIVACRGLPSTEQHWLKVLLAAALVARLAAIGGMFIVKTPLHDDESVAMLSGDEAYGLSRALRTRDVITGANVTPYDYFVAYDEYGRSGYITLLTALQILFGPTPYSMRVFNIVLFMTAALMLFRTARTAFGPLPAFSGLAMMLFWPTLFYWSISLLKEPLYLLAGALSLTGTIAAVRALTARWRMLSLASVAAGFMIAATLRPGGFELFALGLLCGAAMWMFFSASGLQRGAMTAVAAGLLSAILFFPSPRARAAAALESAAKTHAGHVFTVGHAYKLLDEGFYINPVTAAASTLTLTTSEAARYVIRAAISFITVPLPWDLASTRELSYLPEQLMWYALIVLYPIGFAVGWRRNSLAAALFAGYAIPTAIALALTNGNVGTLLRLRGIVIPYVLWLGAVGLCVVLQEVASSADGAVRTATR